MPVPVCMGHSQHAEPGLLVAYPRGCGRHPLDGLRQQMHYGKKERIEGS